jgi:SAM-dependent methyltransferase
MFRLEEVVPWGRSFDEYRRMFDLSDADLASRILGCGDGPASFNAEATRRGLRVVSFDPLYEFSEPEIRQRIVATYPQVLEQTRRNVDEFLWDTIRSVEELGRIRMQAMQTFLDDYEGGRAAGRYVEAELPALPFSDAQFDLALCSHFLFLYSEQLDELFHRAAIFELCRVAREVRIFPLLELGGARSRHLSAMTEALHQEGCVATVARVPYEFQRGGNEMLRITRTNGGRSPVSDV